MTETGGGRLVDRTAVLLGIAAALLASTYVFAGGLARFQVPLVTENPWRELNLAFVPLLGGTAACLLRAVLLTGERNLALQGRVVPSSEERFPAVVGSLAVVASLALGSALAFAPDSFVALAQEDGPLEYGQFALYLSTAVVWLAIAVRGSRDEGWLRPLALLGALGFTLVAGEEISWGQRILEFETPEVLSQNSQGEANLHNLATGPFNIAYIAFVFGALGIGHLVYPRAEALRRVWDVLRPPVPVFVLYSAGIAFHTGMQRWSLIMVSFSLLYYGVLVYRRRGLGWLLAMGSVLYVAALAFLFDGGLGQTWYTVDEAREVFSAAALLLHAVTVFERLREGGPASPGGPLGEEG